MATAWQIPGMLSPCWELVGDNSAPVAANSTLFQMPLAMSEKIVQLNEEVIKGQIKELVRGSVEETLNGLLEAEAAKLTQAAKYERSEERQGYRSGHYSRNLTTTSGDVTLNVPRLKGISFETAIIERYRRRESSVEEALIEMYLAGVSVRRVEDITEALWGSKVSPSTISELNKKAYVHIEDWRNRPLQGGHYPYVYVDGIYLRRNWGGEYENVAILVAIAVNEDGYREVLGAAEGMKEDKASWVSFFQWLRGRGLDGVKLIVGDKCQGMLEAVGEVFPEAKYQRCVVHFYRNVFSVVPKSKIKLVAKMLKAIHGAAYPRPNPDHQGKRLRSGGQGCGGQVLPHHQAPYPAQLPVRHYHFHRPADPLRHLHGELSVLRGAGRFGPDAVSRLTCQHRA